MHTTLPPPPINVPGAALLSRTLAGDPLLLPVGPQPTEAHLRTAQRTLAKHGSAALVLGLRRGPGEGALIADDVLWPLDVPAAQHRLSQHLGLAVDAHPVTVDTEDGPVLLALLVLRDAGPPESAAIPSAHNPLAARRRAAWLLPALAGLAGLVFATLIP